MVFVVMIWFEYVQRLVQMALRVMLHANETLGEPELLVSMGCETYLFGVRPVAEIDIAILRPRALGACFLLHLKKIVCWLPAGSHHITANNSVCWFGFTLTYVF